MKKFVLFCFCLMTVLYFGTVAQATRLMVCRIMRGQLCRLSLVSL